MPPNGIGTRLRRLVIATSRGPLAPLWRGLYTAAARLAAVWLARPGGLGVYLARRTEVIPGLSDIDLVIVTEREEGVPAATARLARLQKRLAPLGQPIECWQIDGREVMERGADRTTLTQYAGEGRPARGFVIQGRPGLGSQFAGLQRLAGPDLLPTDPGPWPAAERAGIAWLELQFWWWQAFLMCREEPQPSDGLLGMKLVAEPLRVLLWLRGEHWHGQREHILRAGLEHFPEEEQALVHALELQRGLAREPRPDLGIAFGALGSWSARIAAETARRAEAAGHVGVALAPAERDDPLPLADWPARSLALRPDARLSLDAGSPSDPAALGRCVRDVQPGLHPALREGDVLVLPTVSFLPGILRHAACPAFDPVSFALLGGEPSAFFPELAGLSAAESARTAVNAHALRLRDPAEYPVEDGEGVARLLAAARAALFLESVEAGAPELCVSLAEVAERLGAEDALAALAAGRGQGLPAPAALMGDLRSSVLKMGPYREAGG